jgi:hypothetical protein
MKVRMNMVKCKNCKFWREIEVGYGDCTSDKFIYGGDPPSPDITDCVLYMDAECYSASLYTGKDFGCIHGRKR